MTPRDRWMFDYPRGDPSVKLLSLATHRWPMTLPQSARVVELGCCETDGASWILRGRPDLVLVGVDVRHPASYPAPVLCQPAECVAFPDDSLDAVIILGALEHFGLSYYGDPDNPDADRHTLERVSRWLAPGGWVYYDVPWTPEVGYITDNRHFRVYGDAGPMSLMRINGIGLEERGRAWGRPRDPLRDDDWLETAPDMPGDPYWYCQRWLVKTGGNEL